MGVKWHCDRCGKFVEDKVELVMVCTEGYDDGGFLDGLGDLCGDCVEDLKEFMEGGGVVPSECFDTETYGCFRC